MSRAMEIENSCGFCGSSLHAGTRFCRQCGNPVAQREATSVTESTTRLLDQTQRPTAPPILEYQPDGGLIRPAATAPTPPSTVTQNLQRPPRSRAPWILLSVAGLFIVVIGLLIALAVARQMLMKSPTVPPVAPPEAPVVPGGPAQPPTAPPPPTAVIEANEFIYPGATVSLQMEDDDGVKLQLQTTDSIEKVAAWYKAKLKPTKTIHPGFFPGAPYILEGDSGKAVITGGEDGASIFFKGGKD